MIEDADDALHRARRQRMIDHRTQVQSKHRCEENGSAADRQRSLAARRGGNEKRGNSEKEEKAGCSGQRVRDLFAACVARLQGEVDRRHGTSGDNATLRLENALERDVTDRLCRCQTDDVGLKIAQNSIVKPIDEPVHRQLAAIAPGLSKQRGTA
jgi:hypothetical protein